VAIRQPLVALAPTHAAAPQNAPHHLLHAYLQLVSIYSKVRQSDNSAEGRRSRGHRLVATHLEVAELSAWWYWKKYCRSFVNVIKLSVLVCECAEAAATCSGRVAREYEGVLVAQHRHSVISRSKAIEQGTARFMTHKTNFTFSYWL
jgi:hypothetical protein